MYHSSIILFVTRKKTTFHTLLTTVPQPLLFMTESSFFLPRGHEQHTATRKNKSKNSNPIYCNPFPPRRIPIISTSDKATIVVSRTGGSTAAELAHENIRKIVDMECTDLEVNTLLWKSLGYRFDPASQTWGEPTRSFRIGAKHIARRRI